MVVEVALRRRGYDVGERGVKLMADYATILTEDDDMRILGKCPPDEILLLEGFVNHTFKHRIAKVLPEGQAMRFLERA